MRDRLVLVPHGDRSAPVPDHPAPRARLAVVLVAGLAALGSAGAPDLQVNPRAIVVLPFDASSLSPGDQWMSEAIAQAISLGLVQQPGLVQIERDRLSAVVDPAVWREMHVSQAGQAVRADAALYGSIGRKDSHLLLQPRLLDIKSGQTTSLPPTRFSDAELLTQFASLSVVYARALQPALTDAEKARIEKAARPTGSVQALELFARGQTAIYNGENERAISLLVQATQADPGFAVASYSLGVVHSALGNRWKAAAQFRAALQLDALMPEPLKAIGDLFLSAPRNLFDQAIEAYSAAIKLRHFYADAYVGLGNAYAAKGEIDRALTAYQAALTFDPFDARTHVRLGQSYAKKGRCAEAVNSYRQAGELDRRSVVVATPCP